MNDSEDEAPEGKRQKNMQSGTITFFNADLLHQKLQQHFHRIELTPLSVSDTTHLYNVNDGFAAKDFYWTATVESDRFIGTFKRGILYRPEIVAEMVMEVENVLSERVSFGVMVKGPQGIGKSHSLVNLVRKLLYGSQGKYLITFIQDCEKFRDVYDLYEYICNSIGTSTDELELQTSPASTEAKHFQTFIAAIASFLENNNKQWVLIFDQINRLFARPTFQNTKDLGVLPFPFSATKSVMEAGRVTSIVSASANNEISY